MIVIVILFLISLGITGVYFYKKYHKKINSYKHLISIKDHEILTLKKALKDKSLNIKKYKELMDEASNTVEKYNLSYMTINNKNNKMWLKIKQLENKIEFQNSEIDRLHHIIINTETILTNKDKKKERERTLEQLKQ